MAKLVLSLKDKPVKEINLSAQRTLIGRRSNNAIHIDHLAVSGVHAVLECIGDHYFIEDQQSTNGTSVNGKKIKRHALHHGDEIKIAKYRLKFISDRQLSLQQSALIEQTQSAPKQAVIRVLTGANAGRELLLNKERNTLGKVGQQVAVISRREQGFFITHSEGQQRPRVNGRPLEAAELRLNEEDLIEILGIRMAFFFR
ncbi:FHA domain-containing protein [Deefgea sp. CFH1-16]|uniref:FHA domain-containing protein n=1 Tax=Deefgea sp. CFH1-16 TaxID=2675457 RepID=UPI0015F6E3AA|nr:FHA domain-containing protein [Deefgea sp. CFH1-16]MBM5573484.1 FHA domain-containing protein [Deefgea sp. CFH1-16]